MTVWDANVEEKRRLRPAKLILIRNNRIKTFLIRRIIKVNFVHFLCDFLNKNLTSGSLPPIWCIPNMNTHHYSQRTSWSQASSQRGLSAWSRWVCSCGGPSQLPPGRGRRRRLPQQGAGWCHPSSTWSPHCTAPCGPAPSPCWPEWSPKSSGESRDVGSMTELFILQMFPHEKSIW